MTTIPTIEQLKENIISNIQSEFGITLNPVLKALLKAIAIVFAGVWWLFWIAIGALQADLWVDTCSLQMLIRYGVIILGRNMFQAVAAQYTCTVTGTTGGVIPGTMVFKSDDSSESPGMLYQVVGGDYTMPGSVGTITIQALEGGLSSELSISDTLTSTAPMVNVNSVITIATVVTDPVDAETEAQYRQAVIEKIQLTPGSWSAVDYRLVGTGIAGIAQTYAYLDMANSNQVDVYLQGETPGTPISGGIITSYETAIALVRPLGTFIVNVVASPQLPVDVTITMGSFTPYTTAQKALISAALTEFINAVQPFIPACDPIPTRNDVIATFNLSVVISQAVPGYGFSSVTFTVNGVSTANWQADLGNIPYYNSVTYV